MCPVCNSFDWDFIIACGKGTVYSYGVYRHPPALGLPVPYTVLVVQLDEGVRVIGNLVDAPPESLSIGMPVQVVFKSDQDDDQILPQWTPATSEYGRT
jgi:uncharacterized OB-fold protein